MELPRKQSNQNESSFDCFENPVFDDSSSLLPGRPYIRLESSTGTDDSLMVPAVRFRDCRFAISGATISDLSASAELKSQQNITEMVDSVKNEIDELLKTPRLAIYQKRNPTSFQDDFYFHPSAKPAPLRVNGGFHRLSAKPEPLSIAKKGPVLQVLVNPALPDVNKASWHKSAEPRPLFSVKTMKALHPTSDNVRSGGSQSDSSEKENQLPSPIESIETGRNGTRVPLSDWSFYEGRKASIFGQSFVVQSPAQRRGGISGQLFSAPSLDFEIYEDPEEAEESDPVPSVVGQVAPVQEQTEPEDDDSIDFLLDPLPSAPIRAVRNPLLDHGSMLGHNGSVSGGYPLVLSSESKGDPACIPVAEKTPRSRESAAIDALVYEIAQPMGENLYDADGFLKESFRVPTFNDDACDEHEEAIDLEEQLRRRLQGQPRPSQILLWGLRPQVDDPVDSVANDEDVPRLSVRLSHSVTWSCFEKKFSDFLAAPVAA
ncbi:hypothetical protein CMUS01_15611 [Colletotrichum musicola]|uniref:Uncharacterized protein n=1 Tax=Colletotrichum musicola TaxID=2175873 RepID=A0A8H6IVB9_9PEZI|nr:hypothetical protein CMUS01_15611 [Colletotrichum musicola]